MTDNSTTEECKIEIKLKELAELYLIVKETILYFEEVNPDQKTDIQPINELRNAFDHLMRATAVHTGLKDESDPDKYILKNIDKSYGHVYRAGYDTVDYLCLTLKEYIYEAIKGYHTTSIETAIPEYYSKIRPQVTELENSIVEYRNSKDIGENNHDKLFDYINLARELGDYRKTIVLAIPSLEELEARRKVDIEENESQYKEKENRTEKRSWIRDIVIAGVVTAITITVMYLLQKW